MPGFHVILEGDGYCERRDLSKVVHLTNDITLAVLPGGMKSGKPSVAFIFDLPDGRWVMAETSLALIQSAMDAVEARYGKVNR